MTEGNKTCLHVCGNGMYELILALLLIYMILDKLEKHG